MGGDDFYIGIYWALVFLPIQVVTVIAYLIGKFTGSNMAGDIAYFCNCTYVICKDR